MPNSRLTISYHVSTYDENRHLQPESALSHQLALEENLKHLYMLWNLVKIIDEHKLPDIPVEADVMDSFGKLGCCIADDAFTHLDELAKEFHTVQATLNELQSKNKK